MVRSKKHKVLRFNSKVGYHFRVTLAVSVSETHIAVVGKDKLTADPDPPIRYFIEAWPIHDLEHPCAYFAEGDDAKLPMGALSARENSFAVLYNVASVRVYTVGGGNVMSLEQQYNFTLPQGAVLTVNTSARTALNGEYVALHARNGGVFVWSRSTAQLLHTLQFSPMPAAQYTVLRLCGSRLVYTDDSSAKVRDLATDRVLKVDRLGVLAADFVGKNTLAIALLGPPDALASAFDGLPNSGASRYMVSTYDVSGDSVHWLCDSSLLDPLGPACSGTPEVHISSGTVCSFDEGSKTRHLLDCSSFKRTSITSTALGFTPEWVRPRAHGDKFVMVGGARDPADPSEPCTAFRMLYTR